MRRLLAIALLTALPAAAQFRSVPPSGTSITVGLGAGYRAPGTPLGTSGYGGRCCAGGSRFGSGQHNGGFGPGGFGHSGFGHSGFRQSGFGRRRHHRNGVVPYYYYPYSYPYYADYPDAYATSAEEYEAEDEDPPALTIYERRSRIAYSTGARDEDRYGEHFTDYRETERRRAKEEAQAEEERRAAQEREARADAERSKALEKPEPPEPATVLVFKDGRHQDVSGYAISGGVLYDLSNGRARKILLADLDLPATTKLNDELGNDFRLPVSRPKQN